MTERVLGPAGSPRRRRTWLLPLAAMLAVGLLYVGGAGASPAAIFELEGNTTDNPAIVLDDWQNLYDGGDGTPNSIKPKCTALVVTNCFDTFALTPDKIGKEGDTSYFTGGGSKDRENIPSWSWGTNDQSPDKNDITNAFAAAYRDDNSLALAFGADRHAVNGDAQMGFWFNQAPMCLSGGTPAGQDSNCPASTPNQAATTGKFVDPTTGALAVHTIGDLLAIVNFDNGGNIGTANVYRWNGTEAVQVLATSGQDCKNIAYPANFCTTSNTAPVAGEPYWPYNAKGGGADDDYDTSAFIEGFIDLGAISGAGTCFPSFLAETRSSSGPGTGVSLDATLKDFALKSFQLCGSTLVTTPKDGTGGTIPAAGLSIGTGTVGATDSAQLDVSGIATWSGTLKFYICGPFAAPTLCTEATGKQIGSTINVSQATPQPVLSGVASLTSVGRYCWAAVFTSNTAGVPNQTDATAGECFSVAPVTPPLDTAAVASPVAFGSAVQDNATLSGTATQPGTNGGSPWPTINATNGAVAGGTIQFTLLKANCSDNATGTGTNPQSLPVSGNGTYGPVSFTPDAPGTYHWKAQYTPAAGDPNNLGSTHNGSCNDTDETVVVQQIPTNIKTKQSWFPNDTATVSAQSGNLGAGGSVVFTLYSTDDCTGPVLYTETKAITGGSPSQEVSTNNTSVSTAVVTDYADAANSVKPGGTEVYSWKVVYTPGASDPSHTGKQSACSAEHFTITYTNDNGPGTSLP